MRKVVSLLLAAVVTVGMTMAAFAANPKITAQTVAIPDVEAGERSPGNQIWLPLVKDAFTDATENLTMADIKASKIAVKQASATGARAIASVEIKEDSNKIANVVVTLVSTYADTKPTEFETKLYLTIDGKRQDFDTIVSGSLANTETEVYADTDYIDLSGGQTAVCMESAPKVEVYIGNDVSLFVKMQKGKKYYGSVSREPDADDLEMFGEFPDIEEVFALTTIGLNGAGNNVKIDTKGVDYYIYNKNIEYLGTSADMLPYSEKYYLAATELDIYAADEPDEEGEPVESEDGETSEADGLLKAVAPAGSKGTNPDTGVEPFFGVAIAAGIVSLAVIAGMNFKKKN